MNPLFSIHIKRYRPIHQAKNKAFYVKTTSESEKQNVILLEQQVNSLTTHMFTYLVIIYTLFHVSLHTPNIRGDLEG